MYYYIDSAGQQAGPVPADQLAANGVTANTLVWKEGISQWTKASDVPELRYLFDPNVPPPPPSNSINSPNAADSQANNPQSNTFAKIIGVVGVIAGLYWLFNSDDSVVYTFIAILAVCLYFLWKAILGQNSPGKGIIWSTIIVIILGYGMFITSGRISVDSEKDVEELVSGTTWSVTDDQLTGAFRGYWVKVDLNKDHTCSFYYAKPSDGHWTKLSSGTWTTKTGYYENTGNKYYGVQLSQGGELSFRSGYKKGFANLTLADSEPVGMYKGDNASW